MAEGLAGYLGYRCGHTHTYLFLININTYRLQIEYTLKDLRSRLRAVYVFIQNDVLAYAPLHFLEQPV